MQRLRITGLVREANIIRQACTSPITPSQRETLKARIQRSVAQIDEICRQHGVRPCQLPAPSRRAYEFLSKLDLDHLPLTNLSGSVKGLPPPEAAPQEQPPSGHLPGSIRFTGLRAFLDNLLDDLARAVHYNRCDPAATLRVVQQTASRLDHYMGRHKLDAGHLKVESSELAAWFRYFAQPPNLDAYLHALRRAQSVLAGLPQAGRRWKLPLLIRFRPSSHHYRWKPSPSGTQMILSTPMISFDRTAFDHLGRMMLGDRQHWPAVNEAMMSEGFQAIRTALDQMAGAAEQTRGMTYDLADVFDSVNRCYFAGQMPRPKLRWTKRLTGMRFGHYDFAHDVVCISTTLDRPDVPRFVIEHVMHHELLHKKHGSKWSGAQRRCHTREFRTDERAFEHFADADQYLKSLSRGIS